MDMLILATNPETGEKFSLDNSMEIPQVQDIAFEQNNKEHVKLSDLPLEGTFSLDAISTAAKNLAKITKLWVRVLDGVFRALMRRDILSARQNKLMFHKKKRVRKKWRHTYNKELKKNARNRL